MIGAESRDGAADGARTKNSIGNSTGLHTLRWYRITVTGRASEDDVGDREDARSVGLTVSEKQTETIRVQVPHAPGAPTAKICAFRQLARDIYHGGAIGGTADVASEII